MTRRLKLAGVGLCAFMFPACMGNTAPTDPYYTGPGIKLMDRNANNATYYRQLPQPEPAPNSNVGPAVVAAAPNAIDPKYIIPAGASVDSAASLVPPGTMPAQPIATQPIVITSPTQPTAPPVEPIVIQVAAPAVSPVSPYAPSAVLEKPPALVVQTPNDPTPTNVKSDGASRGVFVPNEQFVPAWPKAGSGQSVQPAATPPDSSLKTAPVIGPPAMPSLSKSPPSTEAVVPIEAPTVPKAAVSMKVQEPAPANVLPQSIASATTAPSGNETLLVRAIRAFQGNHPEEAAETLKQIDPSNQELLMYLMPTLVRLGEGNLNSMSPEELAMLVDRLQSASSMLKSKASLRTENVCFCRGVRKFADIERYEPKHEFRSGETVFLYAELRNFTCEPVVAQQRSGSAAPERGFSIRLATMLEIRDARNTLIWRTDLAKNDFAQTPPQDYYHTYRFRVPENLPAGVYSLWMTVTDKPSGRVTRKQVELRVGQS